MTLNLLKYKGYEEDKQISCGTCNVCIVIKRWVVIVPSTMDLIIILSISTSRNVG